MSGWRRFYARWKDYFLTDGLMYLAFVLTLLVLFAFFR